MALSAAVSRGFTVSATASTSIAHSPTVAIPVGRVAIVVVTTKNLATTDGATSTHVSVTGTAGNTFQKVGEYTETAAGAADDGSTISLWLTKVTTQIELTDTITATLSGSITDKIIGLVEVQSTGAAVAVEQLGVGQNAFEASVSGMPSRQYWLVGCAAAVGSDNAKTPDADYAEWIDQRSRNNAAAITNHIQSRIATLTADTCTSTLWTGTSPIFLLAAIYETLGVTTSTIASGATLAAPTVSGAVSAFYVSPSGNDGNPGTEASPFLTIGAARTAVQALTSGMAANITVYLRGGVYQLSATETFTPADSGQNGFAVIWRNYTGETPRLSGGVTVTGWSDQGGGLWRAACALTFRQMYVNDVRCVRARDPNLGTFNAIQSWDESGDDVRVANGHIPGTPWARLGEVELVILGKGVNQSNQRVSTASSSTDDVVGQQPARGRLFGQVYPPREAGSKYFFENALEFLDQAGEFYLDTVNDFLYYRPRAGQDMTTAVVRVPQVERLVSVIGTNAATPVHDLQFYGLTFEHATWILASTDGFVGDQASTVYVGALPADEITSYPSERMPTAVYVYDADDIRFERCLFRNCGADGLQFYRGVRDSQIIGNVFYDMAGAGCVVDLALLGNTATSTIPCRRITVANNYITRTGCDYYQTTGIMFGYVDEGIIEHNEVFNLPYVGITVGWGWSYEANTMDTNIVRRNEVWACGLLMSDSAGIYTLSDQNGGLIENNYVHDMIRTSIQGGFNISDIYLDEGSGDITVQHNVCTGQADTFVFQNGNGSGVTLTDNNASDPGGVIAGAGLEAAYEDIRALVPSGGFDQFIALP